MIGIVKNAITKILLEDLDVTGAKPKKLHLAGLAIVLSLKLKFFANNHLKIAV